MNISNFIKRCTLRATRRGAAVYIVLLVGMLVSLPATSVPITGGSGASLSSIAGSPTLVTVVLRGGARDPNLQVMEIQNTLVVFSTDEGDRISYQKSDIELLEIQGSVVEKRPEFVSSTVALRPEDQRIVDTASARVAELFQSSKDNQDLRIWAAGYMAFNGNAEAAEYLDSLVKSNNLQTQLDAARGVYLSGSEISEGLIRDGFASNNRNIRAQTAVIAGLFRVDAATPDLMGMVNDRSAQYAAPAAVALSRMDNREIVSTLLDMLGSTSGEKNDAGVNGLINLGGSDVVEAVKYRIEATDGLERYRLVYILHQLGEPERRKHLIDVFNDQPTIRPEAALVLAEDDYWEAIQYLQGRLQRREDPTFENQVYRARTAHAILQSGDMSAIHVFQSLLREDDNEVKGFVLDLIADLADRSLLKLIQPSIRNIDSRLSLRACNAALATASAEFRARFQDIVGEP